LVPSFDPNEWCLKNELHSGGLSPGPLGHESSALTSRPLLLALSWTSLLKSIGINVGNFKFWPTECPRLTLISLSYYLCLLLSLFLIISVSYYLCFLLSLFLIISVSYNLSFFFRTSTGANPNAWIAITLPESILIRRVKAFPYEVIEENRK
jgi:hypothetical protein